jgi:hypothetical protein
VNLQIRVDYYTWSVSNFRREGFEFARFMKDVAAMSSI